MQRYGIFWDFKIKILKNYKLKVKSAIEAAAGRWVMQIIVLTLWYLS